MAGNQQDNPYYCVIVSFTFTVSNINQVNPQVIFTTKYKHVLSIIIQATVQQHTEMISF